MTIEANVFFPMFVNNARELSRAINVFKLFKTKENDGEQNTLRRHFNEVKEYFLVSYVRQ